MSQITRAQTQRFHGYKDTEFAAIRYRVVETKTFKYIITQERQISYSFFLHQHPFVQQLIQRLLAKGIAGLEAADTDYDAKRASLPGSIRIALDANAKLSIPVESSIALLRSEQATSGGGPVQLSANTQVKLAIGAQSTATARVEAILAAGMTNTPAANYPLTIPANSKAFAAADAEVALSGTTSITLFDGSQATIASGTHVLISSGTPITIPNAIQATVLKSRRLPVLYSDLFSSKTYDPSSLVKPPYPVNDLDFGPHGAYSIYNWELFYHVPIAVAINLSKNQRFAEAQRWFHYIFDPTDDSVGPTPERFWKVRPFQETDVKKIEEILVNLVTGFDETLRDETSDSVDAWKGAPFRPHVIARVRQQAYMYKTVMAYLDNLISWGDYLFRQDTGEAIDEATMVYVLAANILGPRPLPVPKKGSVRPQTYANLRHDLKQFGIVTRDVEADIPFDLMPFPTDNAIDQAASSTLRSMSKAFYFPVPANDKLLGYWDTVADRLFKIHNSLNLQGIFRQLPLFEPPIDPALLARATAVGLDVGAIVNGLNQPLPLVRFRLLVQKAEEIAQEVKLHGTNLLSAMEKEDGEALAVMRAKNERVVMEMVEHVKYDQLQEAIKSKEGLLKSLSLAAQRYSYYERQLGRTPDEITNGIPELAELDQDSLDQMKFAMTEPDVSLRELDVDIAEDLNESGGPIVSKYEAQELAKLKEARQQSEQAADKDKIGGALGLIPEFGAHFHPFGDGGSISFGGSNLSRAMSYWASFARTDADTATYEAGNSSRIGNYSRRELDWTFQSNLAAGEMTQIFKQIRAAEIRQAIAQQELKNHRSQIEQAKEIEHFLNEEGTDTTGKKTNRALYAWMKREVKGLYAQSFQFAFDIAKKAERALQHELGDPELTYIQFDYLAGKEGLLAGEKLYSDIRRMEMAYHDLNQRQYELTKHVSLLQLDPLALIKLRMTGSCTVQLPEALFDMDGPGHYFRRIKSVGVSIPCVTGPYASVSCTLTLLNSSIRKSPTLQDGEYDRHIPDDDRFSDYFGSLQSVVTSSAQNDSGLFETNLSDERYLPFENSGAISQWQLQLPANPANKDPPQFDYSTISDVVLHLRYTAREGGDLLRKNAMTNIKDLIKDGQAVGSVRLFSVSDEFPTEWARFQAQTPRADQRFGLSIKLRPEHYPFWSQGRLNTVVRVDALALSSENPVPSTMDVFGDAKKDNASKKGTLTKDGALGGLLRGQLTSGIPTKPDGELGLFLDTKALADLWVALTWSE